MALSIEHPGISIWNTPPNFRSLAQLTKAKLNSKGYTMMSPSFLKPASQCTRIGMSLCLADDVAKPAKEKVLALPQATIVATVNNDTPTWIVLLVPIAKLLPIRTFRAINFYDPPQHVSVHPIPFVGVHFLETELT